MRTVRTTLRHLGEFLQNVRDLDLQEAEAVSGVAFIDTTIEHFASCVTIVDDKNNVLAIGGVDSETHVVWMLCTKLVEENRIAFLRFTRGLLKDVLKYIPYLHNYCYVDNKLHVDWLTWMGADWGKLSDDGRFRYFVLGKENENV